MMNVTEISPMSEVCTATIHTESTFGEAYFGPIHIGYYKNQPISFELWIECEGKRINLPAEHIKDFMRQIKRAAQLAEDKP